MASTADLDQPPGSTAACIRCLSWRRRTPDNGGELSGRSHLGSTRASCTDSARPPGPLQRVVIRSPIAFPPHRPQPSSAAASLPSKGRLGAATNHRGEAWPPLRRLNRLRCLSNLAASSASDAARSSSSTATTFPLGSPSPAKDPPSSPPRAIHLPSTAELAQPPGPTGSPHQMLFVAAPNAG